MIGGIICAKTAPKFMGSSINSRVGWPGANKIPNKGGLPIQPTLNRDPVLPTTPVGYFKSSFTRNPHLLHVLTNRFPSLLS